MNPIKDRLLVKAVMDFEVAASQGYHALVTLTVERLTGTAPQGLQEFLRQHLAAA